jgi:hypothetical protein
MTLGVSTVKLKGHAAWIAALLVLLCGAVAFTQQRDTTARPTATPQAGTGQITGVVRTPDASPQPVRRVVVTISGGEPAINPRSVLTDDDGRFALAGLPAGRFTVVARKAAYLQAEHGATRPRGAGTPVVLTTGQALDISMTMYRGAAISGVIRDAAGAPVSGIDVRVMDVRTLIAPDNSQVDMSPSDDRGVYRVFGLPPGEYVIVALPPANAANTGAPSAQDVDAALALLTSRQSAVPGAPVRPPAEARPIGFAPVFHPGTSYAGEAGRVRLQTGEDRTGIDVELRAVPFASISGSISGDVQSFEAVELTIFPQGPRVQTGFSSAGVSGRPIDAEGRFHYSGLALGLYRIAARSMRGPNAPSGPTVVNGQIATPRGGGAGTGAPQPGGQPVGDALYGFVDVDLRGDDISGVHVALRPGGRMTGRVVIRASGNQPPPADLSRLRLGLTLEGGGWNIVADGVRMGPGLLSPPLSTIRPDSTFELRNIAPGRFTLGGQAVAEAPQWRWRSAMAGDRDLFDGVLELGPSTDLRDVVITLTDIPTELTGTLQSASGQPTAGYFIVALPANRELLTPRSRRILWTRPDTSGRFTFAWPPAGDYVLTALTDLDPLDLGDLAFLEQVAQAGIKVTVPEGQKITQDLRIK